MKSTKKMKGRVEELKRTRQASPTKTYGELTVGGLTDSMSLQTSRIQTIANSPSAVDSRDATMTCVERHVTIVVNVGVPRAGVTKSASSEGVLTRAGRYASKLCTVPTSSRSRAMYFVLTTDQIYSRGSN